MPDTDVKWGKTGSRENILKDFTSAHQMYLHERPFYEKIISVEKALLFPISDTLNGVAVSSPIPLKCVPDIVFEEK